MKMDTSEGEVQSWPIDGEHPCDDCPFCYEGGEYRCCALYEEPLKTVDRLEECKVRKVVIVYREED